MLIELELTIVFIVKLRLVEVAADSIAYEETEGQNKDSQYYVHCCFTCIAYHLLSILKYYYYKSPLPSPSTIVRSTLLRAMNIITTQTVHEAARILLLVAGSRDEVGGGTGE